ncbi:MAG: putative nuclease of restriction endonuclease-like (RecB) superfamily [Verrucomicrobiales bacterium]|jgi:predicted nuclease of restriction endonuclease-like (RecB) superfamily
MKNEIDSQSPEVFFSDVRQILAEARQKTYAAVNTAMVEAYWGIGRRIVEEEQGGKAKAAYGKGLLQELSKALTDEFGRGFSYPNLRNFRQFYLTYPSEEAKSYALRSKLSWTHHRLIMREEEPESRDYYLKECGAQNWSTRTLERQIQTQTYQRLLSTKKPAPVAASSDAKPTIRDLIKDPYVLEFLQLPEDPSRSESDVESAIISQLQAFLLEMGHGFSFVARQMRISTETSHFYVDLVFYNYVLKCFVIIDLKIKKLTHEDIGQADMYVRMFDDLKRGEDDNPTIGIILCADKDETMVQYSVLKENEQLFASKYRTVLPTEEELVAELRREHLLAERDQSS